MEEDFIKTIVESDREYFRGNNDEFKALEKQIAEAKKDMKSREKILLEDQHYYKYIIAMTNAKFPPYNDKVYDYMISRYTDRPLPDPDRDMKTLFPMYLPHADWLWENMDPDLPWFRIWCTWRKEQTERGNAERPTYAEIKKAFMMLNRQEQVRLIQLYNTEDRQESLDWNVKMQLKHSRALQKSSAKVIELQTKLNKLEKERALSIVQALKPYESSLIDKQHQQKNANSKLVFMI